MHFYNDSSYALHSTYNYYKHYKLSSDPWLLIHCNIPLVKFYFHIIVSLCGALLYTIVDMIINSVVVFITVYNNYMVLNAIFLD